jgi:hypothetical protein
MRGTATIMITATMTIRTTRNMAPLLPAAPGELAAVGG